MNGPSMNRAAFLHGATDLRWSPAPLESLASGRVRVRLGAAGICGSDLHYYRYGNSGDFVLHTPLILGHEVAGTVEALGADVNELAAGDKVAINPACPCGVCGNCREGRTNLCDDIFFMGSASRTPHMQGGFSEYFDVSASQCFKIPDSTSFEEAALCEPLAVALHAVRRAVSASRDSYPCFQLTGWGDLNIAVFGSGPIGLMILLALHQAGAERVTIVDIDDTPLLFAKRVGATAVVNSHATPLTTSTTAGRGFDLAFEATGSPAGLADALRTLCKGGAMVQVGNLPAGEVAVPMNLIVSKELSVLGTFRFNDEFASAVELIASGAIDVTPLITARVPLHDAQHGFESALDRSSNVKVILEPSTALGSQIG